LPPAFKRVSLTGSAELFKETTRAPELLAETEPEPPPQIHPEPAVVHALPVRHAGLAFFQYNLTEAQVRTLVDALQQLKYPHTLKSARPSMEEFERLEALRQVLLDGLR
jgi:hypothetical protein